jgi:NADPH-dependent glutamate synthase beta subunit-like oxidoreductase
MPVSKIDLDKCMGCGTCVESCPMDVFRLDTVVEYRKEYSPCSLACPLGVRQREYHDLLKMGMLDEAADILRLCHPMPAVTGRLCPHPCESECTRATIDAAVNINALEQYLGDHLLGLEPPATGPLDQGRVAIVGSGPSGLAAAYFLILDGFDVTVFEKNEKPGGLLRTAVPAFRLAEDVVDRQIEFYQKMGITFRTGVRVGAEVTLEDLRKENYGAVVAATGAAKPVGLSVPGSDASGIVSAMEFLAGARTATVGEMSGSVAIIGGGSVALDVARTAVRRGAAPVSVICLESLEPGLKDSMLALTGEIEDGIAEGVRILPSRGVYSFTVKGGRVSGVKCVECLSVRDDNGCFKPVYGDCVLPQEIDAQTVVLAIGQTADASLVPAGFPTDTQGLIQVDEATTQVVPGLFAAGDAVSGASTVVEALAAGRKTATMVGRYLRREGLSLDLDGERPQAAEPPKERIEVSERLERRRRTATERRRDFRESAMSFSEQEAQLEVDRCLTCGSRSRIAYLDDCQVCRLCQHYCPTDAIDITEGALLGSLHGWDVVNLGR